MTVAERVREEEKVVALLCILPLLGALSLLATQLLMLFMKGGADITGVMTLPSLGIASPIPSPCLLQLGCCGQREVVNS